MKSLIIYGIPNCDITKMAFAWLKKNKIEFQFHDYKKSGISAAKLNEWAKKVSWESILNKRGTTWRKISPEIQQTISNQKAAVELMLEHTSVIKRPVIEIDGKLLIGFDENVYHDNILTSR